MTEDLKSIILDIPVVDNHCHLFNTKHTEHDLSRILSMSLNDMPPEQLQHTLIFRTMLRELRNLMNIDGSDQEVLEARETRMQKNYREYIRDLFNHARIQTVLVDLGYEPAQVNLEIFEELVPARIRYIYRIEKSLDKLWFDFRDQKINFRQLEDLFYEALEDAVSNEKIVAFKSVIGYRTGLQIGNVERKEIIENEPDEKKFRNYFLLKAIKRALEAEMPFQIHAAFGESNINLLKNNPLLLKKVLDHPLYAQTKIVLLHGGYPYCFEAAYLASVYPNVYVDFSEMIPFVPVGSLRGLSDIFDLCPLNKILYGSDGFIIPEIHWLGAIIAKKTIHTLFSKYISEGLFTEDYALRVASMVFLENANKLYGLEDQIEGESMKGCGHTGERS